MFPREPRIFLPVIALLALAPIQLARADQPLTDEQLQQKVDQLEMKVQALETEQKTAEATTLKSIQSDAAAHSNVLSSSGVGLTGYDPATGFQISSDDGNFLLHPWALGQFRGVINDRQSVELFSNGLTGGGTAKPQIGSGSTDGFEVHNLMLGVNGHVVNPGLKYSFSVNVNSNGGGVILQDAVATYQCEPTCPYVFKGGQFIDPVWHESNVNDGYLLLVDRSLVGVLVGGNTGLNNTSSYTQGVGVQFLGKCLHAEFDLTDGRDSANTPFYDVPANGVLPPQNFGMSARAEYKICGDDTAWSGYNSLSAYGATTDLLIAGAGFEWDEASNYDNLYFTVDAQYTTRTGWTAYAAVYSDYADWSNSDFVQSPQQVAIAGSFPNWGLLMQVGYRVTPRVEVFGRYDVAVLDSNYANILAFGTKNPGGNAHATDNNHEITVGMNYYLYGYHAKVSGDIGFLPNGSTIDATGLGILANQNHSEWVGRLQFQLAI
jgi:hypothetical protein